MGVVEIAHHLHVSGTPRLEIAVAEEEGFHRAQEPLFPRRRRFREARLEGRGEPRQHRARGLPIHFREERVVVAEGLAPVGHGEVRVRRLRALELGDRLLPAEAVQDRRPTDEVGLGLRGWGRGREVDRADIAGGRSRSAEAERDGDRARGEEVACAADHRSVSCRRVVRLLQARRGVRACSGDEPRVALPRAARRPLRLGPGRDGLGSRDPMKRLALLATIVVLTSCRAVTPPSVDLAIENVTVIDAVHGVREHRTVWVSAGRITDVVASTAESRATETLDGTGRFLIPGLWDFHVHLTYDERLTGAMPGLFLYHGITSIRDTGGPLARVRAVVSAIREPGAVAPRVFFAGPLLDGEHVVYDGVDLPRLGIANPDVGTARANVARLSEAGVDFLKIYEMVSPEVFAAIVEEARDRGLPIDAHVPLALLASEAGAPGRVARAPAQHRAGLRGRRGGAPRGARAAAREPGGPAGGASPGEPPRAPATPRGRGVRCRPLLPWSSRA